MCRNILIALFIVFIAQFASAEKSQEKAQVVEVVSVSGVVEKSVLGSDGKDKWEAVKAGEKLNELTIIRTGFASKVVLKFADRGQVVVNNATKAGIREFRKKGNEVRTNIGLKYGTMHATVDRSAGPNDFSISTPVATLSVRGSEAPVGYTGDMGMGMRNVNGNWNIRSDNKQQNVSPGETGNNLLTHFLELARQKRGIGIIGKKGNLSKKEARNLRNNRSGLGLLRFIGNGKGFPGPRTNNLYISRSNNNRNQLESEGENLQRHYFYYPEQ